MNSNAAVEETPAEKAAIDETPIGSVASELTDATPQWMPNADSILPLPWADFHEMHERHGGSDSDLMETNGTLRIEGRCLYLDERRREQHRPDDPLRWVLSLPRGLVQYDHSERAIWIHRRLGPVGPFAAGDEIIIGDASWSMVRSAACGNHRILHAPSIELCSDRHHHACSIAAYSSTHRVLPSEAQRRLQRIPEMERLLAELHHAEPVRTAGWGIDRADLHSQVGESFVAWVWLTGDDPPNPRAQAIAAAHPDIEIRTGASVA